MFAVDPAPWWNYDYLSSKIFELLYISFEELD